MRQRERGVVLLFVMAAVAVLSVIAVELASRASVDVLLASRSGREAAYRRLSDSGTELGRALLLEPEAKAYDFLGEPWNRTTRFTLAPEESVEVRIADESGKIKIGPGGQGSGGAANLEKTLGRLFEYLRRYEPGRTEELRDVESRVILRLGLLPPEKGEPPRTPEPLVTLDGLREAGISPSQIFGEKGLSRYLTTFGDGKVNINTAPPAVLYALHEEMGIALAGRIAAHRGDTDGEKGEYKPYQETQDLKLVDGVVERNTLDRETRVVQDLYSKVAGRISVRSSAFSIRVRMRVLGRDRETWTFFEPRREERAGEGSHRTLRRLAHEEILP